MTARRSDDAARARQLLNRRIIRGMQGIGLALVVATGIQCSDKSTSTAPQIEIQKRASFSIQPRFASLPAGLTIDLSKIRGLLIDPHGDTVVTEALFQGDSAVLIFTVHFTGNTGTFNVDLTAYDKLGQVAFHGQDTVTVKPGNNPPLTPLQPLQYAGADAGVKSIKVIPNPVSLDAGVTAPLGVQGFNASGQQVNAAIRASWASKNPSVATVDAATGVVTAGQSQGTTYIIATSASGAQDSTFLTVNAPVASLAVTPSPAQVVRNDSLQLNAVMKDAAGHTITGRKITWLSSDQSKATVSATGMLHGVAIGSSTVTVIAEGKSVDVPVSVVSPVDHIEATPSPMTFTALGAQQLLAIKLVPKNNASLAGVVTIVTIADSSIVTMDGSHNVTALKNGSTNITIKADLASLVVPVTVQQKPMTLTVSPKTFSASSMGVMQKFTTAILDSLGHAVFGAIPTWQSSDTKVVQVDSTGMAMSQDDGSANVTASFGGLSDAAKVTVKRVPARVSINVPKQTISVGEVMGATGSIVDANGYPMTSTVTWSTSNTAILTVTSIGIVTGVSGGTASLQASAGGMSVGIPITVGGGVGGLGGEIITINDIDQFRQDYYNVRSRDNYKFYINLVDFAGSGPRASKKGVLWYTGHNDACFYCDGRNIPDSLALRGYTTTYSSASTLTIGADIKVAFLFLPTVNFSAAEITALKQLLSEGGRVVFVGEHPGYYYYGRGTQNDFFFQMGSAVRMTTTYAACLNPASIFITDIAAHQITTGVHSLLADCAAAFTVGPTDIVLGRDSAGFPTFVLTTVNSAPLAANRSIPSATLDRKSAPMWFVPNSVPQTDPRRTAAPKP